VMITSRPLISSARSWTMGNIHHLKSAPRRYWVKDFDNLYPTRPGTIFSVNRCPNSRSRIMLRASGCGDDGTDMVGLSLR
jgi:hypothetical protein